MDGAVEMTAERHAVVVDYAEVAERHDLEAARIGQDRPVPVHERVEPAESLDPFVTGSQVEVVRVGQDDRGASVAEVVRRQRLDRRIRPDRHELRRLDDAVGQCQAAGPCPRGAVRRRRDLDGERGGRHLSALARAR